MNKSGDLIVHLGFCISHFLSPFHNYLLVVTIPTKSSFSISLFTWSTIHGCDTGVTTNWA